MKNLLFAAWKNSSQLKIGQFEFIRKGQNYENHSEVDANCHEQSFIITIRLLGGCNHRSKTIQYRPRFDNEFDEL